MGYILSSYFIKIYYKNRRILFNFLFTVILTVEFLQNYLYLQLVICAVPALSVEKFSTESAGNGIAAR